MWTDKLRLRIVIISFHVLINSFPFLLTESSAVGMPPLVTDHTLNPAVVWVAFWKIESLHVATTCACDWKGIVFCYWHLAFILCIFSC